MCPSVSRGTGGGPFSITAKMILLAIITATAKHIDCRKQISCRAIENRPLPCKRRPILLCGFRPEGQLQTHTLPNNGLRLQKEPRIGVGYPGFADRIWQTYCLAIL